MDAADALDDSFEETRDEVLDLVDFANLKDLLQLGKEESLLDAVGERPILEKTFEQRNGESTVLRQEEHRAAKQLFVKLRACLHLVERDDDSVEEDDVLIPERNGETRDDTGEDVEQLGGTVELVVLVDESEEALVNSLSNHLSAGHEFGVELMQDVLEIVSLDGLLGIEKLEELLDKLNGDINLQLLDINRLIDDELQEKLIDTLKVRPGGIDLILLLDTGLRELEVGLLDVGQGTENVLLNHGHNVVQMRND
jgi:hypothetical protein